ncbi:GAF and ANTAR domain-containing protein [Modestobacter sp. VKM Ac-2978]|uniref:GAF and ANTAR domain-containing protein n=1 Tax=Modestobacter sp. VKM Ac-2978 TaxID=3004132 RepID=UPI0022AB3B16|nr:GAF and ANTAR domain-containing protein [Modestobacter sp. VKM Ac-2978]MCZ2848519.1 GAF and ANTAR domain-containing protein [Modestobacter sp. VKM Ac-2978]
MSSTIDPVAVRTLGRLGADLAAGSPSHDLVERLVDDLSRPFGLDFSIRYELPPAAGELRLHTTIGVPAQHRTDLAVVPLGVAVCGMVAEQRRPEAHARVDADPDERLALARELDATAYASFPLAAGPAVLGTLSVGSRTRPEFGDAELAVLGAAADLVTVAAARERDRAMVESALAGQAAAEARIAHLETALVTNRTIATAIGVVMTRRRVTDEQAHRWLVELSQRTNRKLRVVAEQIVHTGSLEV